MSARVHSSFVNFHNHRVEPMFEEVDVPSKRKCERNAYQTCDGGPDREHLKRERHHRRRLMRVTRSVMTMRIIVMGFSESLLAFEGHLHQPRHVEGGDSRGDEPDKP